MAESTDISLQQSSAAMQFEDITPWAATGGDTGLSARLKLKRNFERVRTWGSTVLDIISRQNDLLNEMFTLEDVGDTKRIRANYGLYTEQFLSALGLGSSAASGGGSAASLADMVDVDTGSLSAADAGKALVYDGTHWVPQAVSAGLDETALAGYLTQHSYVTSTSISNMLTRTDAATQYAPLSGYNSHVGNTTIHITAAERTKWNKVVTDFAAITGADSDSVINKWEEVVAFLDTYTEADTLAGLLGNKVDKVTGKGLSANDFTDALLAKLNGIEDGANKYALPTASATVKGGVKVGSTLAVSSEVLNMKSGVVTAGTYRSVTVDTYGRVTAGTTPTTLAGYGITDAKIVSGVITLGGSTITPVTSVAMTVPTGFSVSGSPVSKTGTLAVTYANGYEGFTTALKNKLNNLYDFVHDLFAKETEDGVSRIKANYGLYTEQFLSALGASDTSGGGGATDLATVWTALGNNTKEQINYSHLSEALNTALAPYALRSDLPSLTGYATQAWVSQQLPTTLPASDVYAWAKAATKPSYNFSEIGSKPTTLAGYGITDGVNAVTVTGSGNAVTSASISGHTLTLTKGTTFLTSHQSVSDKSATLSWDTLVTVATVGSTDIKVKLPANPNTWRGIQNNLTSQSTTDSLSAYQGYLLANGSARDNTKLPLSGGTLTGNLTTSGMLTFNRDNSNPFIVVNRNGYDIKLSVDSDGLNIGPKSNDPDDFDHLLYVDGRSHFDDSVEVSGSITATGNLSASHLFVTDSTLVSNLNADMLDGYHASGLFTSLANSGNTLSVTVGGTTRTLTVAYATSAGTAAKLSTVSKTAWGQTFWTSGGVPQSISGLLSSVSGIKINSTGSSYGYIDFHYGSASSFTSNICEKESGMLAINEALYARRGGTAGVGTAPDSRYMLTVNGNIKASRYYFTDTVYFERDDKGVRLVGAGFYSDSFVSALGAGTSGGGGGGADLATVWTALGNATTEQVNASHLSTALSAYATLASVNQTVDALSYVSAMTWQASGQLLVKGHNMEDTVLDFGHTHSYNDLTDKPTSWAWSDITGKPATLALTSDIPTNNSQLTNGAGYVTATNHNHGLLHNDFTASIANNAADTGWALLNGTNTGFFLKSIRFEAGSPSWLGGSTVSYGSAIAFGGSDTKGVITTAYDRPFVKFAGGSTEPRWWMSITGATSTSYDLATMVTTNTEQTISAIKTFTDTVVLAKANDLGGGYYDWPALVVGGLPSAPHIEIDSNEIHAKSNTTTVADLYINWDGGQVHVGPGGLAVNGVSQANTFKSTVATGTAPLTVASTTAVTNLNADMLDGWHLSNIMPTSFVTCPAAGLSSYWVKVWDITITNGVYNNHDVTFLFASAYQEKEGIIHVDIRQNGANNGGAYGFTAHLYELAGNIPLSCVRLYYNNATGYCALWVDLQRQYNVYNVTILKKSMRTAQDSGSLGQLYNTNFTTVQTPPNSAYIQMAAYSLVNNTATATALLNTRTLWGQSFNGTANVTGSLSGVTDINMTGDLSISNGGIKMPNGNIDIGNFAIFGGDQEFFIHHLPTDKYASFYATTEGMEVSADAFWVQDYINIAIDWRIKGLGPGRDQLGVTCFNDTVAVFNGDSYDLTLAGALTVQGTNRSSIPKLTVGGYSNASYALSTASFICNGWIHTTGSTGWYNETYGGGWCMTDSTYIRNYNTKQLLMNNQIVSTSVNFLRSVYGSYGAFFRNDGTDFYLLFTNAGDQYGSFNALRPLRIRLSNGEVVNTTGIDTSYVTLRSPSTNYYVKMESDQNGLHLRHGNSSSKDSLNRDPYDLYVDNSVYVQSVLDVEGVIHSQDGIYSDFYVSALGQNTASDLRLKQVTACDVLPTVGEIAAAPAIRYLWRDRPALGPQVGSAAQYWQQVLPEAVRQGHDGMLTMEYGVIALLAAIRAARTLEDHERRIARLEGAAA